MWFGTRFSMGYKASVILYKKNMTYTLKDAFFDISTVHYVLDTPLRGWRTVILYNTLFTNKLQAPYTALLKLFVLWG